MRVGIMKTNGGTHSAQDWAMVTAAQIMPLDDSLSGGRLLEAQKLQLRVAEALIPHHEKHHGRELSGLAASDAHFDSVHVEDATVDAALIAVVAEFQGTPWQDHVAKAEVRAAMRHEIGVLFATHSDVERQHHADRNPGLAGAVAYKLRRHNGGPIAPTSES